MPTGPDLPGKAVRVGAEQRNAEQDKQLKRGADRDGGIAALDPVQRVAGDPRTFSEVGGGPALPPPFGRDQLPDDRNRVAGHG